MGEKSSVNEIRKRFDQDVERFSNLETGQAATIDAPLSMKLIVDVAAKLNPNASSLLDVGCGAGNYTLALLKKIPGVNPTLVELSQPMLERAEERISKDYDVKVDCIQGDIRTVKFSKNQKFDFIFAAAVLHHLREETEWRTVFNLFFELLKPGGSIWISDLITHSQATIQSLMWKRYGEYLSDLKDKAYRDHVFDYINKEDSPRPLLFQLSLLNEVGFKEVDILHKNSCFAAFGAVK